MASPSPAASPFAKLVAQQPSKQPNHGTNLSSHSHHETDIPPASSSSGVSKADTSYFTAETSLAHDVIVASSDYGSDLDSDQEREISHIISQIEEDNSSSSSAQLSDFNSSQEREISQILSQIEDEAEPSELNSSQEHELALILSQIEGTSVASQVKLSELVDDDDDDNGATAAVARMPKAFSSQGSNTGRRSTPLDDPVPSVSYYSLAKNAEGEVIDRHVAEDLAQKAQALAQVQVTKETDAPAAKALSPLQRFRRTRPLAVSDLVAPAWCELQYSFSLSKYGRIRRTQQMKRGGEVHRELELEVHEFVPVEVKTREDGWGLRLWNVIQGLRTLRATGMTRELDVWGIIDGQVVSGVIDELTNTCPDPGLELALADGKDATQPDAEISRPSGSTKRTRKESPEPPKQVTIDQFFAQQSHNEEKIKQLGKRVYIIDTKTRAYPNLPTEQSFKGTRLQLMLYHKLLSQLCTDQVPGDAVFARYKIDATAPFSEVFLNEIANLEFNFASQQPRADQPAPPLSSQADTFSELLQHPNLGSLWRLMVREFRHAFSPGMISLLLTAVFRAQATGALIGQRSVGADLRALDAHTDTVMQWWTGRREPRGVEIEEAGKCRICEFAEGCHWRMAKEVEAAQIRMARKEEMAAQRAKTRKSPKRKSSAGKVAEG